MFGNPLLDEILSRGGNPDDLHVAVSDAIKRNIGAEMDLQALVVQTAGSK